MTHVIKCGRESDIAEPGVHSLPGGIYLAGDDAAQSAEAGKAGGRANENTGYRGVILDPTQLKDVGAVVYNDYVIIIRADIIHKVGLCSRKLEVGIPCAEVVVITVILVESLRVLGSLIILAALPWI